MGVVVAWWRPRSSKSVWGGDPVPGGFDSHPLPPAQNPGGAYSPGFLLYNGPISTWRSIVTVLRIFILGLLLLTSTTALMAQPGPVASPSQTPIVVDHNSVALFERIPENYLMAAQATSMLYMDRSVGGNISEGLDCLAFPTDEVSLNHCRRWAHVDPNFSVSREDLNWSRPGGYSRANWDFVFWPGGCSDWSTEVGCFFTHVDNHLGEYSVVSFQFSYLEISPNSEIADRPGGFFWDNSRKLDVYDLEAYEAAHPEMEFIYWYATSTRQRGSPDGYRKTLPALPDRRYRTPASPLALPLNGRERVVSVDALLIDDPDAAFCNASVSSQLSRDIASDVFYERRVLKGAHCHEPLVRSLENRIYSRRTCSFGPRR